jgi:hypothetical protein
MQGRRFGWLLRGGLSLAFGLSVAACSTPSKNETAASEPDLSPQVARLYGALIGAWRGQLEYRVPRTERRVRVQTVLTVSRVSGTDALRFDYVYAGDGGAEPLRSSDRGRVDFAAGIYQVQSIDGKGHSDYTIERHQRVDLPYREELVLVGPGIENGAPVDTRITISVTELSLRVLREAKPRAPAGSAWQFRHEYMMTRQP